MRTTSTAMEQATLLLLADDMIIYMENWRDRNDKLYNEGIQQVNHKKLMASLIHFSIQITTGKHDKIKYLLENRKNACKNYQEIYRTYIKIFTQGQKRRINRKAFSQIGKLSIVKISSSCTLTYTFSVMMLNIKI